MLFRWHTAAMPERIVVTSEPLNAETPLGQQTGLGTPAGTHYVRTHFPQPTPPSHFTVDGAVRSAQRFDVDQVRALRRHSLDVTLECAGNGRAFLEPPAPGEPWRLGAVGTALWTGVPLRLVLERADVLANAKEILFRGADVGRPKELDHDIAFERSLPLATALSEDVIVAYLMDGAPIPREHGGPLRLVVPGWYGMASVKWLEHITVLTTEFAGFYQKTKYVIDGTPLTRVAPRAVITSPIEGEEVRAGALSVGGYAWSGAPVVAVEVSTDYGDRWRKASCGPALSEYAWRQFRIQLPASATRGKAYVDLVARATDTTGETQPLSQRWNALGYMNNGARPVRVRIV